MKYFIFQLKTALDDFKRNKTRTFLASLGILIGVMSVVMLIALGLGLRNYIEGQFENLGTNLVIIFPGSGLSQGAASFGPGLAGGAEFDERDADSLRRVEHAQYVVPVFLKSVLIEAQNKEEFGYIFGTNEEFFEVMNAEVIEGRLLTKADIQRKLKDTVLGNKLAEALFDDPKTGVGKTLRIANQRYKIVGVMEKTGDNETDGSAVISYRTTYGSLNPDKTFFSIYLGVQNEDNVESVKKDAEEAPSDKDLLVSLEEYKKSGISLGTRVITEFMRNYVFKRRPDGLATINTNKIDRRIRLAANILSQYAPEDIVIACKRESGWKGTELLGKLTGMKVFTKKYPAGIITNIRLEEFFEPSLVLIVDPWIDKAAMSDAIKLNLPVISLCDTNNITTSIDLVVPCNNKSGKSLGLIFWILARELIKKWNLKTELPPLENFVVE